MKKRYLSIAAIALLLNGCGDSSSSTITNSSSYTDVTVERGPVIDSTVKDAAGNIAIAQNSTNVYRFSTDSIKYPITATGGWIDIDGDGIKDDEDIVSELPLKSYSVNVTPITTYIADENATKREELLKKIAEAHNLDENELLKLPSKGSAAMNAFANAVYIQAQEEGSFNTSTNHEAYANGWENNPNIVKINSKFSSYKNMTENSDGMTNGIFDHVQLEKTIISQNNNIFTKVNQDSGNSDESLKAITVPKDKDVAVIINVSESTKNIILNSMGSAIEETGSFTGTVTCSELGFTDKMEESENEFLNDGITHDSGYIIDYSNLANTKQCVVSDYANAYKEGVSGNISFYIYYDRKKLD